MARKRADGDVDNAGRTAERDAQPRPVAPPRAPGSAVRDVLEAAVDAALVGEGAVVLLRYGAGGAAAPFLEAAVLHARLRSVRVLRARCESAGGPLQPWRVALGAGEPADACGHAATVRGLEAAAREEATLLVLEELHRADADSLRVLERVASAVRTWPLAIVATYRDHTRARTPAFGDVLGRVSRARVCELVRLGRAGGATAPERAILRPAGDYWTLAFEGQVVWLHDSRGLRCLATLLLRPGEAVHVTELRAASGAPAGAPGRAATERARVAVTKCLKAALDRIAAAHPAAGRYLMATVHRGYACVYRPDPQRPIAWQR